MNYKIAILVVSGILTVMGVSNFARANMDKSEHSEFVQTLQQAAAELKNTNPMIADKLNGYAEQQKKWTSEKDERWNQKQEDAGTIRTAAAELQATRKDMSDDLNEIVERDVAKGAGITDIETENHGGKTAV